MQLTRLYLVAYLLHLNVGTLFLIVLRVVKSGWLVLNLQVDAVVRRVHFLRNVSKRGRLVLDRSDRAFAICINKQTTAIRATVSSYIDIVVIHYVVVVLLHEDLNFRIYYYNPTTLYQTC